MCSGYVRTVLLTMHRRAFLERGCALVGIVALSGCTTHSLQEAERDPPPLEGVAEEAVDLPVQQRLDVAATAIERTATEAVGDRDAFAGRLEAHGVPVEHLAEADSHGDPALTLEYVGEPSGDRGAMHHLGVVAGTYAAAVAAVEERATLEVTLLDARSEPFGEYEIRPDWAEAYTAGDITAEEYAKEIAVTLAST